MSKNATFIDTIVSILYLDGFIIYGYMVAIYLSEIVMKEKMFEWKFEKDQN